MSSVLVVDDESDFVFMLERLLGNRGYEVQKATTGKEALEKVRERKPSAVIVDVLIPEINGWEVAKKLKEDPETQDLPIIMLSVLVEDQNRWKSFDYSNADWHISKTSDIDFLLFILDLATKKRKYDIEKEIEKAVTRDESMRQVLQMINPKLIESRYDFLNL